MTRAVLFDLSGVLYVGGEALPGAVAALQRVRDAGLATCFVTNVSQQPRQTLLAELRRMGLPIDTDALLTAPDAAHGYLQSRDLSPYLLVHPALESEFDDLVSAAPNAVLLGDAGDGFTHARMNRAFRLLMGGAPLVAMGNNRYFRQADGLSLDIGPYVAALEFASGTRAVLVGKPAPAFFAAALRRVGCEAEQAVMIGDDALADVQGAIDAGLGGILVRTGKYQPGDEKLIEVPGARVCEDVGEAVDRIIANRPVA